MKLFVWQSNAFRDYAPGSIAVMAPSLKAAKAKVLEQYEIYAGGFYFSAVKADISREPEIIESGVIHFIGSA